MSTQTIPLRGLGRSAEQATSDSQVRVFPPEVARQNTRRAAERKANVNSGIREVPPGECGAIAAFVLENDQSDHPGETVREMYNRRFRKDWTELEWSDVTGDKFRAVDRGYTTLRVATQNALSLSKQAETHAQFTGFRAARRSPRKVRAVSQVGLQEFPAGA